MKRNEIIADIQLSFIELDTLLDCLIQELEDLKIRKPPFRAEFFLLNQ